MRIPGRRRWLSERATAPGRFAGRAVRDADVAALVFVDVAAVDVAGPEGNGRRVFSKLLEVFRLSLVVAAAKGCVGETTGRAVAANEEEKRESSRRPWRPQTKRRRMQ